MSMVRSALVSAVLAVLAVLAMLVVGPEGVAMAAAPNIAINHPVSGILTNSRTPLFSGTTNDTLDPVTLEIYEGASATGSPVQTLGMLAPVEIGPLEGSWEVTPVTALPQGQYTAVAEQTDTASEPPELGTSAPVTFTVDTTPPAVSIDAVPSPTKDAEPTLTGSAGVEAGDDATVAVEIYQGDTGGGTVVQSTTDATVIGGEWSYTVPHLADGTYTAQAEQSDEAGNTGKSEPLVTFTVDTTPPVVSMTAPANLATLTGSRPTFSGLAGQASGDDPSITLKIYEGISVSGSPVQTLAVTPVGGDWTTGSTGPALPDGIYTAQAEQSDNAGNTGTSNAVTFTIVTSSPVVTLDTSGFVQRESGLVTGATPSFSGSAGTAPEDGKSVTVKIYSGESVAGSPMQIVEGPLSGSMWMAGPVKALPNGTYTAQAEQQDSDFYVPPGVSAPFVFTVDADPPLLTLTSPANSSSTSSSSQVVSGSAGTAEGDSPQITIQLFAGSTTTGPALEAITVQASKGGGWSATFGGLSPGTYTAQAEQRDDVGNIGHSAPATFTLTAPAVVTPPTPTPPVATNEQPPTVTVMQPTPSPSPTVPPAQSPPAASFQWFPSAPHVGEPVSLVSTSTDADSPIAEYAWSLEGNGAFNAGAPVITVSFSTPGDHVVQLRVVGANGLTSVATETIPVTSPAPTLMQPFPVVRIAGSESASGVKLGLLTVQAPVGATVTVTCHGPGCPTRSEDVVAASRRSKSTTGVVLIAFRRFERSLWAGAILEIRVSERGQIGKYTSFAVRRGKLPARVDTCLSPAGIEPIVCPSS